MSSGGASKYGKDGAGAWSRDADGLPCYDWDLRRVPATAPPWPHLLGSGPLQITADQHGTVQLLAGPATERFRLNPPAAGCISALRLELQVGERLLRLLPLAAPAAWQPQVRYGCGYVAYSISLRSPELPLRTDLHLELAVCPGKPFVLAEITFRPGPGEVESLTCGLSVASDVGAGAASLTPSAAPFAREGAAMLSLGEGRGDAFLAGSSGWESLAGPQRLELRRTLTLRPREAVSLRLLLGHTTTASLQWLRQQFEGLTGAAVKSARDASLQTPPVPSAELWMREDLIACRSALAAYQAPDPLTGRPILHPVLGLRPPRTAHRLILCPFLQRLFPDLVRDTLVAIALRQGSHGQLPETLSAALPADRPDPALDRSDPEVAFLWAGACWLSDPSHADWLDRPLPVAPHAPTFGDRLMLAASRVREGIGCGPHGLLRLLAGDGNGALNQAGRAGAGESVLSSAQFCAALHTLTELFRHAGRKAHAERLDTWQRELSSAVADAFQDGAFLRGYTDTGAAIGRPGSGPVFLDVQAWAVLARCGTVSQREEALNAILTACEGGPLTALTSPYPTTWPAGLSRTAILPGEGLNAGVSLLEAAWFLQALAIEGRSAEALACYQALSLRRRAAAENRAPFPAVAHAGRVNGPAAQAWAWWPDTAPAFDPAPDAAAVAWQEEVLRAILTPSPGT